jgi:indolepyruvate ferredoxin oxidoreductase
MKLQTTGADLDNYTSTDRYTRQTGRVLLTGTQALVRIVLDQRDRDRADGINSAGFVSSDRGSPLGGVDLELWRLQTTSEAKSQGVPMVPR